MNSSSAQWFVSWTFRFSILAVIALAISAAPGLGTAFAQKEKPGRSGEPHDNSGLKQAFGGAQVDLYFEMGEVESSKPGLAGVKFVDVVDVTGKELLHFDRSGDSWLIDPDTVFVYKLHKSK